MRRLTLFVFACSVMAAGCGGTPIAPTVVPPPTTTEVFTGTISPLPSPQYIRSHTFMVARAGTITIELTSAGPPATIEIGLGVGVPATDGVCTIQSGNGFRVTAGPTSRLTGNAVAALECIAVFDVGNMTADVDYSVTVVHP